MFPPQFQSIQFYQKKKDILIYKANDEYHHYILKGIISKDAAVKQAFYDEYAILHTLKHPSIPTYYGMEEDYLLPGQSTPCTVLLQEDCPGTPLSDLHHLSLEQILTIIRQAGDILLYLLDHGILYTDLNPSNLLIDLTDASAQEAACISQLYLLDYTYCYYFKRNPNPAYSLRISYDLDTSLRGQQLLIQALTYLFLHLLEKNEITPFPYKIGALIETGLHPSEALSLSDFLSLL